MVRVHTSDANLQQSNLHPNQQSRSGSLKPTGSPTPSTVSQLSSSFWGMVDENNCLQADPTTHKGRKLQLCKMVIIVMIPILILLAETLFIIGNSAINVQLKSAMKGDVKFSIETGLIVHVLQIERGLSVLYISSSRSRHSEILLQSAREETDKNIGLMPYWPEYARSDVSEFSSKEAFHGSIKDYRSSLRAGNHTTNEVLLFYVQLIEELLSWSAISVQTTHSLDNWPLLVAYHLLMNSKEQAGLERALGSSFFATGKLHIR